MDNKKQQATIRLTKTQLHNLIEFIELLFIDSIRNDPDVDNIDYVVDMMKLLTKLRDTMSEMKSNDEFKGAN